MNSDRHESAAWRTFGMLDTDEAAGFDDALRHNPELRDAYREMNSLSAAIGAASVAPLAPRPEQLQRLKSRLGLKKTRSINWAAISGWGAAAAMTTALLINQVNVLTTHNPTQAAKSAYQAKKSETTASPQQAPQENAGLNDESPILSESNDSTKIASLAAQAQEAIQTKNQQLKKELDLLREKFRVADNRNKQRIEPVQGLAWPIVMTMKPPGAIIAAAVANLQAPTITDVLGDALAGSSSMVDGRTSETEKSNSPAAVPIYDPATGEGTLVISLPKDSVGDPHYLWVIPEGDGQQPEIVGKLPAISPGGLGPVAFSLKTGTIPHNFIITNDAEGESAPPSEANTILIGPQ